MPQLLVDSRTLLAVRDELGRLQHQLLGMPSVLAGYDGCLGGRGLEAELETFARDWHYATAEIGGRIGEMMRRLVVAAAAYRRIERRLTTGSGHERTSWRGSGTTTVGGRGPMTTAVLVGPSRGHGTTTIS